MPSQSKRSSPPQAPVPAFVPPYPPSWVDRFTDWVDRLPIPWWSFYLIVGLLLEVLQVTILWRDGIFAMHGVQFFQFFFPVNYVLAIFLMHAFDRRAITGPRAFPAGAAARRFTLSAPAIRVDDAASPSDDRGRTHRFRLWRHLRRSRSGGASATIRCSA